MKRFSAEKNEKLSKAVAKNLPFLSYAEFRRLLRQKDVKINGKRVSEDLAVSAGDEIVVYDRPIPRSPIEILYRDENILVAVKPKSLPSVGENSLETRLKEETGISALCVAHRLDTNTEGLNLAAVNDTAFEALKEVFRTRKIEKRYVTIAMGKTATEGVLKGYLEKDADASRVTVLKTPKKGAALAVTEYRALKYFEDATKLDVTIFTGRTHQIRAQLSAAGHPVLGDGKYGDYEFNRRYRAKSQVLKAYYLKFNANEGLFSYLNGQIFQIDDAFPVEEKLILR